MDNKPLTAEGTATTNCQSGLHSLAGGEKPVPAEAEQSGETFDDKSRATAPSPCRRWEARRVGKEKLGCEVDGNRAGHGDGDICWLVKRSRFTLMAPFTNFTKYIYIYIYEMSEKVFVSIVTRITGLDGVCWCQGGKELHFLLSDVSVDLCVWCALSTCL